MAEKEKLDSRLSLYLKGEKIKLPNNMPVDYMTFDDIDIMDEQEQQTNFGEQK